MTAALAESLCFHPDNAMVVRILGGAVVVIALAGLAWLLRDVWHDGGVVWRRAAAGGGWLVLCTVAFLLVTRSGTRLTADESRKLIREEAWIGGVRQVRELPFSAFQAVTVTISYIEWASTTSSRPGMGPGSKHVSPAFTWRVALDGAEHVDLDLFKLVEPAESRALDLARRFGLPAQRRDYRVGPMTAEERRDFREIKNQIVPGGDPPRDITTLGVGTFRIRAVTGESQGISPRDWPDDETRTIPIIRPKRQ